MLVGRRFSERQTRAEKCKGCPATRWKARNTSQRPRRGRHCVSSVASAAESSVWRLPHRPQDLGRLYQASPGQSSHIALPRILMNPRILHRRPANKNGRQMPGSIHLPGWVGLLLERLRTGLRVESLTPWQSSVSAGIHCYTNPYHANRNGVNSIWRLEASDRRFSWPGGPPHKNRPPRLAKYSASAPTHRR
jgi:hypothetical protein